jgi:hypothetical protein
MGSVPSRLAVTHLMPIEFVLNVSLLEKFFSSRESQTFRQRNVNDLSYCDLALQHEKLDFCFLFMTIVLENLFHATLVA